MSKTPQVSISLITMDGKGVHEGDTVYIVSPEGRLRIPCEQGCDNGKVISNGKTIKCKTCCGSGSSYRDGYLVREIRNWKLSFNLTDGYQICYPHWAMGWWGTGPLWADLKNVYVNRSNATACANKRNDAFVKAKWEYV